VNVTPRNPSKRMAPCPQCGKRSEYSPENPCRPFCSERCKLIDLGQWASENYRVPTQERPDDIPDN
jgi:endogenous inhibitor of DNA gyrase (YacG/DUF329 family)